MDRNFENIVLNRIEKSFDLLIPIGSLIAYIMAFVILRSDTPIRFFYFDTIVATLLLLLFIFRKQIKVHTKIIVVVSTSLTLGVFSVFWGGFSGTGITIMVTSNIVAISFLSKRKAITASIVTMASLLFIYFAVMLGALKFTGYNAHLLNSQTEWLIHGGTLLLLLIISHVSINSIKQYLLESINKIEESAKSIYNLAYFDKLTGLANYNKFIETIPESDGILALVDIKGFKVINSIYGLALGDKFLKDIAMIFKEHKRPSDIIARVGDTEFAWWVTELNQGDHEAFIEYSISKLQKHIADSDINNHLEFNIGYAMYPKHGQNLEDLFSKATMALEKSKQLNGAKYICYDDSLSQALIEEETLKNALGRTLSNNGFSVYYQEKVNAEDHKVIGLEALARWHDDDHGYIPPNIFIPILEKTNQMILFGNQIITSILEDYKHLVKKYKQPITVSINISPSHFLWEGFVDYITEAAKAQQIAPQNIILEITEEVMIEGIESINHILHGLRSHGFKISLDDFGTGYSSLSYLSRLELDELKIDRSFVMNLSEKERDHSLIKAIIQLKETYNFNVVAEGVETKEQSDIIRNLGCDEIQGYYFSRPEPIEYYYE